MRPKVIEIPKTKVSKQFLQNFKIKILEKIEKFMKVFQLRLKLIQNKFKTKLKSDSQIERICELFSWE